MESRNVNSLAQIARLLDTTPQAVSNWKARNQVPYHIVNKINNLTKSNSDQIVENPYKASPISVDLDNSTISISDILLLIAQQLKIIITITFISVFTNFTYVQFLKEPSYESSATILLPQQKSTTISGIAGLASQFGVNVPENNVTDLSSPSLYPELITSRRFTEKILKKEIYLNKFETELSILAALTHGIDPPHQSVEMLLSKATKILNDDYIEFKQFPQSPFSTLKVSAPDPKFAKDLANIILTELDSLSRFFKIQHVKEKTLFIEERIFSVKNELESSETRLKKFKEQNRQISSPALQLEQDRLNRDVEVQKGIYLTLKQQLELAKIEEVQEASLVQILDPPQLPLWPSNKNLKMTIIISLFTGVLMGTILGFVRAYFNNNDISERKKLRRTRTFLKKKGRESLKDRRITGLIMALMFVSSPFYFGYKSQQPLFFGRYSLIMMIINLLYIFFLIFVTYLFIRSKNNSNQKAS